MGDVEVVLTGFSMAKRILTLLCTCATNMIIITTKKLPFEFQKMRPMKVKVIPIIHMMNNSHHDKQSQILTSKAKNSAS